jgi:hypothetical protein
MICGTSSSITNTRNSWRLRPSMTIAIPMILLSRKLVSSRRKIHWSKTFLSSWLQLPLWGSPPHWCRDSIPEKFLVLSGISNAKLSSRPGALPSSWKIPKNCLPYSYFLPMILFYQWLSYFLQKKMKIVRYYSVYGIEGRYIWHWHNVLSDKTPNTPNHDETEVQYIKIHSIWMIAIRNIQMFQQVPSPSGLFDFFSLFILY